MPRMFDSLTEWKYSEKEVKEKGTGKTFTLTQPKKVFEEDFYHIKRSIACENVPTDVAAEEDFFVYEVSYMLPGCQLCVVYVSEDTATELVSSNVAAFLQGRAHGHIVEFFKRQEKK